MAKLGKFITFEGIDGCGKTTQLRLLAQRMRDNGLPIIETIEPGGTEIGKQIRRILLDAGNSALDARAELMLYFASRAQNVEQVIRPALASSTTVLCDRFTDSTLVYQGCGRGLESGSILEIDRFACRGLAPDLTILFDIDLAASRERSIARNQLSGTAETRIDDESAAFHARVREGYHALARQFPERIHVVDGSRSIHDLAKLVWEQVEPLVR